MHSQQKIPSGSKARVRLFSALALVSCLALLSRESFAQISVDQVSSVAERPTDVPTLLITPNRLPSEPRTIGSSFSVLEGEDIELLKVTSVSEALRGLPGVSVVQTGNRGAVSSVFIRGAEADQVLVLVDGVRLNESTTGGFDFSDLSVDNIERIEVLRGPQGLLYGSEAMGGVIQIITKKPVDGPILGASLEAGSYGTHRERLRAGYGSQMVSSSTELSWEQTDGQSTAAANRGNSEKDGFEAFSLSSKHSVRPIEGWEAAAGVAFLSSHTELDGFDFEQGPIDDPDYTQSRDRLVLDSKISGIVAERVRPSVAINYVDETLEGKDPTDEFNEFEIDSSTFAVLTQADISLVEAAVLTLGHNFEQRQGENRGSFSESRDVNAFFFQQQLALDPVYLSGGLRHEFDSDFGEETTYRVTAALPIAATDTRLHSSYGTGFKAPSFNELAFPNFGNPKLRPETSWGYDLGVEQKFSEKIIGDLTFFHNSYDNLIGFDTETFLAENISDARALGFETTLRITPSDYFNLDFSYTYTDSKNKETGAVLARRPRHQGSAVVRVTPIEDVDGSLRLLFVQSRRDSDGAKMDNYATLDATVRYQVNKHLRPYVRLVNLLDESYEEIPGFSTPGFSAYAGIDVSFF